MKKEIIKPPYYDKFSCKGGSCKFNCCQEWIINISKTEYEKILKAKKSDELNSIVENAYSKIGKGGSYKNYAAVAMNDYNNCSFLREDGLCAIQAECGYGILPRVCKIFPRCHIFYKNRIEQSLSLGCERVVELLIEEKDGIILDNVVEDIDVKNMIFNNAYNHKDIEIRPILEYYYDIKILSLAILQNREFSLDQRVLLLGMALKKIDTLEKEKLVAGIPSYSDQFLSNFDSQDILSSLGNTAKNNIIKVLNALYYCDDIKDKTSEYKTSEYNNLIDVVFQNLGVKKNDIEFKLDPNDPTHLIIDRNRSIDIDLKKYDLSKENFDNYFKDKEYILENIMVSYFLYNDYPFLNKKRSVWDNYIYYVSCYNTIKCIIAGYLTPTSTEEDLIHCVSILSRKLLHSKNSITFVTDQFIRNESATLAHMAWLIL